jgi:hypothetical protein
VKISILDANTSTSWMANPGSPKHFTGAVLNSSKNFVYGRTNAPKQSFVDSGTPVSHNAFIYYEAYCNGAGCDKNLLPDGLLNSKSTDDPRWFINTQHTAISGTASIVTEKTASGAVTIVTQPTGNHQDKAVIKYDGTKGYPFTKTMENNASAWLIYNKYIPGATKNDFDVAFINNGGSWVGIDEANSTTNSTSSLKSNRRSMW